MEMMFLIVKLNYASVVMPEKYSVAHCAIIAEQINKTKYEALCIPSSNYFNCLTAKPDPSDPSKGISVPFHCEPALGK